MATEKLETEIRQEQIAQAALSLVASHGVGELSIAGIARRVGLVPSAIYRHFGGKEEVLDAVIDHIGQRLAGNVATVRDETSDPLECLHRLLVLHVRLIEENRGMLHIVFSEAVYSGHPERKTRLYRTIRSYLGRIADIVRDGQMQGQVRKELDPATVSVMFMGLIQPAAILWHMSEGDFDLAGHAERAWQVFAEAVRGKTK